MASRDRRPHSHPVILDSIFLNPLTERDRRWPRIGMMALALPGAFLAVMIVGGLVAGLFFHGDFFADAGGPRLRRSAIFVLQLGAVLGALALAIMLAARKIFDRPLRTWLTGAPRFRWGLLVWGAGATALGVGVLMLGDATLLHGDYQLPILDPSADIGLKLTYLTAVVIGLFAAASAEEVVFRGYLLQQTAALTRNGWVVIAINAALFALMHMEFDPAALAARALAGAAFAWAALRLGGLEFAIGAHVATNLMIALFGAPMLPDDPAASGDMDDIVTEVILAFYMVWTVEMTRRMPRLLGTISSPA